MENEGDTTLLSVLNLMQKQMEQQQLLMQQMQQQSASRETDLRQLLGISQVTHENVVHSNGHSRPISSKDAPKLMANVSLNEFNRWYLRWCDFVACQHLESQSNDTLIAAM